MELDRHESVYDKTVMSWLDNAMEHAHARNQGKLLACLECVRNELTEMRHETELPARRYRRRATVHNSSVHNLFR